jgi:hypothetical protein
VHDGRFEPGLQKDGDERLVRDANEAVGGLTLHGQVGIDWW